MTEIHLTIEIHQTERVIKIHLKTRLSHLPKRLSHLPNEAVDLPILRPGKGG